MPNHTPELTPDLLAKIRDHVNNDLPIGSTTAKEWLRAQQAEIEIIRESRDIWEKEARLQYRLFNEMIDEERQSREENERLRGEMEQIKAERDDYRKALEWYASKGIIFRPGEDWDVGHRARSVLSRYKRGDGQ